MNPFLSSGGLRTARQICGAEDMQRRQKRQLVFSRVAPAVVTVPPVIGRDRIYEHKTQALLFMHARNAMVETQYTL